MRIKLFGLAVVFLFLVACGPTVMVGNEPSPGGLAYPGSDVVPPTGYPAAGLVIEDTIPTGGYPEPATISVPAGAIDLDSLGIASSTPHSSSSRPVAATPPSHLSGLIWAIARHLNVQADVPIDEIVFLSAESVRWPDTGLGCPDPELAYADVIVEGYLVMMADAQRVFEFHTDGGTSFVLCRNGRPVSTGTVE